MTSSALQDIIALLGCPAAGNPAQYLYERAIEALERSLQLDPTSAGAKKKKMCNGF